MRDVLDMWSHTRMVVLTAVTASLYAAILVPFKVLPIIPGVTEFRPANAVPVVCSFLFGPAAAWGAAIGNLIGDFFGGIGPGAVFGFVGNFVYGLLPYKLWEALGGGRPLPSPRSGARVPADAVWLRLGFVVVVSAAGCAVWVGWGLNVLGFVPFSVLGNIVFVNNAVVALVLAPVLLPLLYPRVERAGLLYREVLPPETTRALGIRRLGVALVAAGALGGLVLGNLASTGAWLPPFAQEDPMAWTSLVLLFPLLLLGAGLFLL
ncbi:MAG: hypothetical protein KatS3mg076_1792 [Candidatus Binatia bacterium]|nr:MAG: hypothetical protein KatS3mg076_1792 [Candidatus Binatia bacterium]